MPDNERFAGLCNSLARAEAAYRSDMSRVNLSLVLRAYSAVRKACVAVLVTEQDDAA